MKMKKFTLFLITVAMVFSLILSSSAGATRAEEALWADGEIWDTILTPASFKAPKNQASVDILYVTMNLNGQRPIAEAAPYEDDYNGGRWWVHAVHFTDLGLSIHDPDGDGVANFELTSDDVLHHHMMLGHLTIESTNTFFVCPLVSA